MYEFTLMNSVPNMNLDNVAALECRSGAMAESMRYETFFISARDSSHI